MDSLASTKSVALAAWICMVCMGLVVLMKLSGKYIKIKTLQADDYLIATAALLAVGQTVAVSEATSSGLGSPLSALSGVQLEALGKASLTSQLLYILSNCLSEISYVEFLTDLSVNDFHRMSGWGIGIFIALRGIATLFASAFQCSPPDTWSLTSQACFNRGAFWASFAALDALSIVMVLVLSTHIVVHLQMPWTSKMAIATALAAKILVIPTIILRAVWLRDTQDMAIAALATQVDLNLNIITTCVPFLKVIIDRMESNFFGTALRFNTGMGANNATGHSYTLKSLHKSRTYSEIRPEAGKAAEPDGLHLTPGAPQIQPYSTAEASVSSTTNENILSTIHPDGGLVIEKETKFWTEEEVRHHASGSCQCPLAEGPSLRL